MPVTALADIRALHERGLLALGRGRPREALRLMRRADRLAHRPGPEGDAGAFDRVVAALAVSIAATVAETEGIAAGEDALRRAEPLVRAGGDPALEVKLHNQRAYIAARSGRYADALSSYTAAAELIEHAEPNERFGILLNTGTLHMMQGDLRASRHALRRAAGYARDSEFPDGVFKALHNLACVEHYAGRLPRAISLMDEAGAVEADVSRGVWLLDRARVLAEAGLLTAADESLGAAGTIFAAERLGQDLGEVELERAHGALVRGDAPTARRFAMRARDRFRRRGSDGWRRSAELVLLEADLAAGRPGRRLTGPALRLRAEFTRTGLRLPARTAALIAAEAHLSAGELPAAADVLAGLERPLPHDPVTARLHTHYVRARADVAGGRPGAATRRVRTALRELASYQATFGSIDLATAAAVHGRRLADLDLSIALASGRAPTLFAAAERTRAVAARLPTVRPPDEPEVAELLADLRQTVETLRTAGTQPQALDTLARRRRRLEAAITARSWRRVGGGVVRSVAGVDEVAATLDGSILVSFSLVGVALHAVVLDAGGARLASIGPAAEVDETIRRVRADLDVLAGPQLPPPLRAAVAASLQRSLTDLDRTLLAPLRLDGRRLVVVTTGLLGQLPWPLLPSLRDVPVVVAPSATAWHAAHCDAPSARADVVAVAGPGLSRADDERRAVAEAWPAARAPEDVTGARFAAALSSARVLHVAAHGTHQAENPLFSSLRLDDGPLFAHELDSGVRTPEHVVLSACELGLATVRPGDEALGLTSVLLRMGTRSVVAGVARVGDAVAADAMADYHRRLADGADSAAALAAVVSSAAGRGEVVPFANFGATFLA